jgi:hypothetical protein
MRFVTLVEGRLPALYIDRVRFRKLGDEGWKTNKASQNVAWGGGCTLEISLQQTALEDMLDTRRIL